MTSKRSLVCVLKVPLILITLLALPACRQNNRIDSSAIDFESRLSILTNLQNFARTPRGRAHLESTYDRSGGNNDWGNVSDPGPDGLKTIANLKGPGCLTRIWQTNIPVKKWFFFFDGEREPRLVIPGEEMFGPASYFKYPLTADLSGGSYSYVQYPFANSLRIAIEMVLTTERPYYQLNYETYDSASTRIASFPEQLTEEDNARAANVQRVWTNCAEEAGLAMKACKQKVSSTIMPGQSATWIDLSQAGVLKTFWINWSEPEGVSLAARTRRLRELVLRIYWDGAREPSVDVPLGDFFCNALNRRKFSSLPISVLDRAFVCRFPMPFRKAVRAEIRNDGMTPVPVEIGYDLQPLDPATRADLNYFHACWNSSTASGVPYRVLHAEEKGHYVGCYMVAMGTDGSWNLLEGDESMSLDGETTPSLHGTGLEDYFNGGWYYRGLFDLPLHGLVEKAAMQTAQYRFHLADPISFQKGFLMNWEFGGSPPNMGKGYMSSVAYWYQPKPHPAGSQLPDAYLRFPANPLLLATAMSGLFELECIKHYDEAAERCLCLADRIGENEFTPLLRLRSLAYRELIDGFKSVRRGYEQVAAATPQSPAARQAQALLWLHAAPSNALLATHASMKVALFLDGKQVGSSENPLSPAVFQVAVPSGEHEIAAEVIPLVQGPWVSFHLKTQTTNVVSDNSWECASARPANWPRTDDAAVTWTNVVYGIGFLPQMGWWQFAPNGFVNMQSGNRLIQPARDGWDKQPIRPTYLRKRFVISEAQRNE